jgi:hypothetical protein
MLTPDESAVRDIDDAGVKLLEQGERIGGETWLAPLTPHQHSNANSKGCRALGNAVMSLSESMWPV